MAPRPTQKSASLTPAAFLLGNLFGQFKTIFPKYQAKFAPELTYEQVMRDVYALRLHDPNSTFMQNTILPLFAYTRGPLQRLQEAETRFTGKTFLIGTDDQGQSFNLDLRFGMCELPVPMRVYFPNPEALEEFEANYLTTTSINQIRNGRVKVPYLDQYATYTCIWGDLEDIDWSGPSKGQCSVALTLELLGPTLTYQGDRSAIEKIILEFRDYDHPEIVYDVEEFDLRPRSDLPNP